jgi:hypothetical protein
MSLRIVEVKSNKEVKSTSTMDNRTYKNEVSTSTVLPLKYYNCSIGSDFNTTGTELT